MALFGLLMVFALKNGSASLSKFECSNLEASAGDCDYAKNGSNGCTVSVLWNISMWALDKR